MVAIATGCIYIILNVETIMAARVPATGVVFILSIAATVSIFEAARRVSGLFTPVLMVISFLYGVYSNHFPGILHGLGFSYPVMMGWVFLSVEGVWGRIIETISTVVAGFIIFGAVLRATRASDFFTDLALALAGSLRGGPAKAAVAASALFGTLSGSVSANVATTGTITIPLMKSRGFNPNYAGAVESVASTGGMFTPPVMGAIAFLIAEFLGISYWKVCIAAFPPALVYYIILYSQIHFDAARWDLRGVPREQLPPLGRTLRAGWQFILPIIALVFFLGVLSYSAWTAILYTIGVLIVITLFKKETRLTPKRIAMVLEDSARGMIYIVPICAILGILVAVLIITGLAMTLTSGLVAATGGSVVLLLVTAAAASFVLGMGSTALTCYLITVILMAPALIKLGIAPIAAHMFLFYMGTLSFITPPVAIACFVACSISGGDVWRTGWTAVRLGFAAFLVPWIFVWNPPLVAVGSAVEIIWTIIFAVAGGVFIASAFSGYLLARIRLWERVVLGMAGIGMFVPSFAVRLIAAAIIILLLLLGFMRRIRTEGNESV